MTIGLIQYVVSRDRLRHAEGRLAARAATIPQTAGATSAGDGSIAGFTRTEWMRMSAVLVFFVFAAIFWAAYEQAASTLNLFTDKFADRTFFGWTIPTSWFVSIQALFVFILAPVFAWLWVRLGRRAPSTPAKFAIGLLFAGISFVVLFPAGVMAQGSRGATTITMLLVGAYFLQVIGELCLSPVGNSVVTKLAPIKVVGMMMGLWFLSIAAGNKLSGFIAGLSATVPYTTLFSGIAALTLGAALVLFLFIGPIRRLMGGVH